MAETRKDAGQARQRPRPPATPQAETEAMTPSARPAGISPVFDADAAQLKAREGPYKGMISNPWVRHWTQDAQEQPAAPSPEAGARTEAAPNAGEAPPTGSGGRVSSDAGPAPKPARGGGS